MADPTPTPWKAQTGAGGGLPGVALYTADDKLIACAQFVYTDIPREEQLANFDLIVRAVNRDHSFDALLEALEKLSTASALHLQALRQANSSMNEIERGIYSATILALEAIALAHGEPAHA